MTLNTTCQAMTGGADAAAGRVLSEVDLRALVLDVNGVCCGPCPLWDCLGRDEPVCW